MTAPDEFLSIDTPENVVFGYEVAGIGSRFLAALIDTAAIAAIQGVVYLLLILVVGMFGGLDLASAGAWWVVAVLIFVSFVLLWGYYIFFEVMWNGQSPGKRAVKLRVIRTDGRPITLTESVVRNLVRVVDFLPTTYGIGVVVMFLTEQSQRLGDLAAGTLVVFDQGEVTLESLRPHTYAQRSHTMKLAEPATPTVEMPVQRLTEYDARLIEQFLQRRYQLVNAEQMSAQIIEQMRARMELPPQTFSSPSVGIAWLAEVLEAYRTRHRL